MASVASPYGLRPVQLLGGLPYAGAIRSFTFTTNNATKGYFFGDPVGLSGTTGDPTVLAASPVPAIDTNSPVGVFMGCEWQDPIRGFVNSQYFPVNGISAGATQVKFKILDCPTAVFKVQSSGSIPATSVGKNIALTAASLGTGSTATGDSLVTVTAAPGAGALALKIVGFLNAPGSAPGDAFTDILVIWNVGIHRWTQGASL
jgi:hypothetical protein